MDEVVIVTAEVEAEDEVDVEGAATGRAVSTGLEGVMLCIGTSVQTFFGGLIGSNAGSRTGCFVTKGEVEPLGAETAAGMCA
jgi:hypothetical protein